MPVSPSRPRASSRWWRFRCWLVRMVMQPFWTSRLAPLRKSWYVSLSQLPCTSVSYLLALIFWIQNSVASGVWILHNFATVSYRIMVHHVQVPSGPGCWKWRWFAERIAPGCANLRRVGCAFVPGSCGGVERSLRNPLCGWTPKKLGIERSTTINWIYPVLDLIALIYNNDYWFYFIVSVIMFICVCMYIYICMYVCMYVCI